MSRRIITPLLVWCFLVLGSVSGQALTGFTQNGQNWTYDPGDGGEIISGILIQPTFGTPPYPAVLISHGQSGAANTFGLAKANIMKSWGFVCIAPNYTHTNTTYALGTDGWSPENERRARACITILGSLTNVDMTRVAAYGHSKGAWVTCGFAGAATNGLHTAAITAGGTSGTSDTQPASPAVQEVQAITVPFLMLHGSVDTTVFPIQSANLQSVLKSNGIANKRLVFENINHNIESDPLTTNAVFNLIREWFTQHGILNINTNTRPSISNIANQTIDAAGVNGINFTAGDAETSAANVRFQIGTTLPSLLQTNNVIVSGTTTNRLLSLTPTNGISGTVTISISAFDGQLTDTAVFNVTVVTNSTTNAPSLDNTNFAVGRPRGIFVLDSAASTTNINGVGMRDANIRNIPFVSGYVLRASWEDMETQQGQFDFTIIDWNVRKLEALGQKMSLWALTVDPPWVAQTPGVATWFDSDPRVNHPRAVPWDSFLQQRLSIFVRALAEHEIDGVKFKNHPVLNTVNFGVAGAMLAIRDPQATSLRDMTNYTRANFTNAVVSNLRIVSTNFPSKFIQIGFWPVADAIAAPSLWEELRSKILSEFNGTNYPRVGFWMENLSASRPAPGQNPINGKPVTSFASPLFASQTNTWAGFQALTSWSHPFNNYDGSVTNATPSDGLEFAYSTYGSTYCELYVSDIDTPAFTNDLASWQAHFVAAQPSGTAGISNANVIITWNRAAAVTIIEKATNVAGVYGADGYVTNAFRWTNSTPNATEFYRLHQRD